MDELTKLKEERAANKKAVLNNTLPTRVPIDISLSNTIAAEYAGVDKKEALWHPELIEPAILELSKKIFSDVDLFGAGVLYPSYYQALGSKNCVMSDSGIMQHPNTVGLAFEDYDAFIENAYDCVIERVLPSIYTELDFKNNPGKAAIALAKSINAQNDYMKRFVSIVMKMREQNGLPRPIPFGGGGYAPMDFLADQLRSLSGLCTDLRRDREKVKAAVDSALVYCYKSGFAPDPDHIDHDQVAFFALHMPPYIRTKDFEDIWWPAWFKQVTNYAHYGMRAQAFAEQDLTRYFDYFDDLPTGTVITFEKGDPQQIKDRFGKKLIITGLFPVEAVSQRTKEECIDLTKKYIDILAPGGNYFFGFDKKPLVLADINIDNLAAIADTVRDYGVYSNPGEKVNDVFHKEDYALSPIPEFTSKYYKTWEQYKAENPNTPDSARKQVERAEFDILKYIFRLCQ